MQEYYELEDDVESQGRWFLNGLSDHAGRKLDARDLTYGISLDLDSPLRLSLEDDDTLVEVREPLKVSVRRKGMPLDFTYADFDLPVVRRHVAELMSHVSPLAVQRIPVRVGTYTDEFEIINIKTCKGSIDAKRSEIEWWTEEDERPDKVGTPRMVSELVIDRTRARGCHIFRPEGWEVVIVVSEIIKSVLQQARVSGIRFRELR